jgi:hypothetical protein
VDLSHSFPNLELGSDPLKKGSNKIMCHVQGLCSAEYKHVLCHLCGVSCAVYPKTYVYLLSLEPVLVILEEGSWQV